MVIVEQVLIFIKLYARVCGYLSKSTQKYNIFIPDIPTQYDHV